MYSRKADYTRQLPSLIQLRIRGYMFSKILVAIDNREHGEIIVDRAIALAKLASAKIFLLNVASPFDSRYPNPGYIGVHGFHPTMHSDSIEYYMEHWETLKAEGLELLEKFRSQVENAGLEVESRLVIGNPGQMICNFAKHNDIDLIVMGRRGRSGISEILLGSVSNYVVHHAPCSVLTVQGQDLEAKKQDEEQVMSAN